MMPLFMVSLKRRGCLVVFAVIQLSWVLSSAVIADETQQTGSLPWARQYKEGEIITYHMKVTNRDRFGTWIYEDEADGVVKRDSLGKFYEEFAWVNLVSMRTPKLIDLFSLSSQSDWTNLTVNQKPLLLPPASLGFRQQLGLPPYFKGSIPDLSKVAPPLIAPITDLLTFYSDMLIASHLKEPVRAGDHFYVKYGKPSSWADGTHVVIGEDSIDFDCTLQELNDSTQTATILIRHVPPEKPQVKLPADWMLAPVSGTPNNWVEVTKNDNGTYTAAVGQEIFDAVVKVSLKDGRILSARLDNPVEARERKCTDATLETGNDPVRYQIRRQIEVY